MVKICVNWDTTKSTIWDMIGVDYNWIIHELQTNFNITSLNDLTVYKSKDLGRIIINSKKYSDKEKLGLILAMISFGGMTYTLKFIDDAIDKYIENIITSLYEKSKK